MLLLVLLLVLLLLALLGKETHSRNVGRLSVNAFCCLLEVLGQACPLLLLRPLGGVLVEWCCACETLDQASRAFLMPGVLACG